MILFFQIRFQEIGGILESACNETNGEDIILKLKANNEFNLKPFAEAHLCITKCCSHGVFLPQLFVRFFKFTLQMLARLNKWSEDVIETKVINTKVDRVDFLILLYLDVMKMNSKIPSIFDNIVEKVPLNLYTQSDLIEKCFNESRKTFNECIKRIESQWNNEIIAQTSGWTKQVADIPRLYRKTNREAPTKPCNYVEQILRPAETFWNKNKTNIEVNILRQCLVESFSHLNQQ